MIRVVPSAQIPHQNNTARQIPRVWRRLHFIDDGLGPIGRVPTVFGKLQQAPEGGLVSLVHPIEVLLLDTDRIGARVRLLQFDIGRRRQRVEVGRQFPFGDAGKRCRQQHEGDHVLAASLRARRAVNGADRYCGSGGRGAGEDSASSEPARRFIFFVAGRDRTWFRMRQIGHRWLPPLEPAFSRAFSSMNVKSDWLKNFDLGLASGGAS